MNKKLLSFLFLAAAGMFGSIGFGLLTYTSFTALLDTQLPHWIQADGTLLQYSAFALCVLALALAFMTRIPPQRRRTYGSAHFATLVELREAGLLSSKLQDRQVSFLELGTYHRRYIVGLIEQKQQSHVLLVAPTGKRKTSGIIIPGLLQERGKRSLFINDIKGELISKTAGALAQYMTVRVFQPTRPEQSLCYNPLAFVHSMEDAEDLAVCLIENTGKSQEEFWNAAAKLLLTAAIVHIRHTEPDAPFCRLADLLASSDLEAVKATLLDSPSELAKDIVTTFIKSVSLNERLAGSVMTDIAVRLLMLKNPAIRKVTSQNELSFNVSEASALFLSIPMSSSERLKWLSSCLMMQMMKSFVQQAEQHPEQRLPRGVAFYLDEFANIGRIPHYLEYISLVRSLGISFIMAIQNFGQLIDAYGEHGKDTIIANANSEIVFPGCGLVETQYYSDKVGVMTATTTSRSGSAHSLLARDSSESRSETQRRLLTADEIRTMKLGTLLVFSDNLHPFFVKNCTYLDRPELQARIVSLDLPRRELPVPPPYKHKEQEQAPNEVVGIAFQEEIKEE